MSQSVNNPDGGFSSSSHVPQPTVPTVSAAPDLFKSLKKTQAEIDRIKAEELIEALSDPNEKATVVSFAAPAKPVVDVIDGKPGSFAEQDPYVDAKPANHDSSFLSDSKSTSLPPQQGSESASGLADDKSTKTSVLPADSTSPKDSSITPPTSGISSKVPVGGNAKVQEDSPAQATEKYSRDNPPATAGDRGDRTVEDILALLPGYCAEEEASDALGVADVKAGEVKVEESTPKPEVEVVQSPVPQASLKASSPPAENNIEKPQNSTEFVTELSQPLRTPPGAVTSQPASGQATNLVEDELATPVAWYSNAESEKQEAKPQAPQAPASVPVMTEDPVTGEQVFDINDFSELAEQPILAIPGALKSDSADYSSNAPEQQSSIKAPQQSVPVEPSDQPKQPMKRAALPAKIKFPPMSSSRGNAKTDVVANADVKAQVEVAVQETSSSATSENASREKQQETLAATDTAPSLQPATPEASNLEFSKSKAPVKNLPEDLNGELAAAFVACDDIADPILDHIPMSFSEETFDGVVANFESLSKSPSATEGANAQADSEEIYSPVGSADAASNQNGQEKSAEGQASGAFKESWSSSDENEELFLAGEGDVIQIDGDEGYDFIDLACFERSAAKISGDRIEVTEECGSTFEVQFRNVSYVEFANGVRVDLPVA